MNLMTTDEKDDSIIKFKNNEGLEVFNIDCYIPFDTGIMSIDYNYDNPYNGVIKYINEDNIKQSVIDRRLDLYKILKIKEK